MENINIADFYSKAKVMDFDEEYIQELFKIASEDKKQYEEIKRQNEDAQKILDLQYEEQRLAIKQNEINLAKKFNRLSESQKIDLYYNKYLNDYKKDLKVGIFWNIFIIQLIPTALFAINCQVLILITIMLFCLLAYSISFQIQVKKFDFKVAIAELEESNYNTELNIYDSCNLYVHGQIQSFTIEDIDKFLRQNKKMSNIGVLNFLSSDKGSRFISRCQKLWMARVLSMDIRSDKSKIKLSNDDYQSILEIN